VYENLRDTASYRSWWPGTEATDDGLRLRLGRRTVDSRPDGHRDGIGLWLPLPAFDGSLEWLLDPFDDGTIVHAFLDLELPGGPGRARRRLLRFRASVRRALVGLKRSMESR